MRPIALGLLLSLLGLLAAGPVAAHAVLESSLPEDGAVLAEAPASVLLRFNEPVAVLRVGLLDAQGATVEGAAVSSDGTGVRINLPMLGDGTYVVSYRVVSLDSHSITGSILFSVGAASATAPPPLSADGGELEGAWEIALAMVRTVVFAGSLGASGLLLFVLGVGLPAGTETRVWRLAALGLALAAPALLLQLGFTGGLLMGAPAAGLFDRSVWGAGWASSLGNSLVCALAGILVFATALVLPRRVRKRVALIGVGLLLGGFLLTGHAAVAEPAWLFLPAMAVHIAAAFWFGSAAAILLLLGDVGPQEAAPIVRRFSIRAVIVVSALIAAGVALGAVQLGGLRGLLTTDYGRLLLGKVATVALVLGLAAANKWRFTPRLATGDPVAHRGLRRFVGAELALMLLVLLLTALLTQTAPPHGPARAAPLGAPGETATAQSGDTMAMLEVTPAVAGRNEIRLFLHDRAGAAVDPLDLSIELTQPEREIEPIRRTLERVAPGRYRLEGPELAFAGEWRVTVRARLGEFDAIEFEFLLPVAAP